MKSTKVKKWVLGLVVLTALAGLMVVTGCDPEKPAGPGGLRTQPYSSSTGQFK
jgi:hypothetical protein